jgi:hypothetical protein
MRKHKACLGNAGGATCYLGRWCPQCQCAFGSIQKFGFLKMGITGQPHNPIKNTYTKGVEQSNLNVLVTRLNILATFTLTL